MRSSFLENGDATASNISYFLNNYLLARTSLYNKKSRVLIAYSGHGVPHRGAFPPALVLANATSIVDVANSYSLSLIRTSVENLADANFHVVALLNACNGGTVFSYALGGGQPSDSYSPGTYALTAGADDQLVYSLGTAQDGSIFFDEIIKGIKSGAADPNYPTIVVGSSIQKGGVVRLGALSNYLDAEIEILNRRNPPGQGQPYSPPWIGPLEPSPRRARGGFFFLSPVVQEAHGFADTPAAVVSSRVFDGPVSSIPGRPDVKVFNAPADYPIRGVDLSQFNREINWRGLASAVNFAYLRASNATREDSAFKASWQSSKEAGIARGAYHVLGFCGPVEREFDFIRSVVPKSEDALPFAVDAEFYMSGPPREVACARSMGTQQVQSRILQMARLLQGYYGKVPLIYGPRQAFSDFQDAQFSRYMIWFSSFARGSSTPDLRLGGRNPWTLWQYTEAATVPGVPGKIDDNVFFGTAAQFQRFKAKRRYQRRVRCSRKLGRRLRAGQPGKALRRDFANKKRPR